MKDVLRATALPFVVMLVGAGTPETAVISDPASSDMDGMAVRLEVSPEGFGAGRSPLLESAPDRLSLDEAYEAELSVALRNVGIDPRPDVGRSLHTWLFAEDRLEAVVRFGGKDEAPAISWVVVHDGGGVGSTLFEAMAEAVAKTIARTEAADKLDLRGFNVYTVDDLVADLSHRKETRRYRATARLGRLRDPRGLDALRAHEPPRRDGDDGESWFHEQALREPSTEAVAQRHWQRGMAAARRGELPEAAALLQRALDSDPAHVGSLYALGDLLIQGAPGVERNVASGLDHIRRAMEAGHPDAAYLYGYVHARGEQVDPDPVEAAIGFDVADRMGHEQAGAIRDSMTARLTEVEAAEVRQRIEQLDLADLDEPLLAGIDGVTTPFRLEGSYEAPRFPARARRDLTPGLVILQAVIDTDGLVQDPKVLRVNPTGYGFEDAAVDAVRAWRFRPATLHGRPVKTYLTISVSFALQ